MVSQAQYRPLVRWSQPHRRGHRRGRRVYMRALGKLCSSSLPLRLSSEDRSVCSLARSAESVACSTFSYSVTLCAGSEFRVRGETRPVGGRSLGAGVEARLLADCAACGAPPGLRTHAKGRALRRALSSILTGASPVALTPDGRAGRVLCEKRMCVAASCVASQRRASAAQAHDRLADRGCHTDRPVPGGHISLQR